MKVIVSCPQSHNLRGYGHPLITTTDILGEDCIRIGDVTATIVVAAWLNGSTLVLINKVTLRRARLVLGWVTIRRWVNHFGL